MALDRDIIGADQRVSGTVRLTATEMLATRFIMPHMPRFHALHPELTLELECTTRFVSMAPSPRVIWQAVHADLQRSARIRAALDFLSEIVTPVHAE